MNAIVDVSALEARIRQMAQGFDESAAPKAKRREFISFSKPGRYVARVLPSRNYPADVQFYRQFGKHFLKPPGSNGIMLPCSYHWHGKGESCPVCKAIFEGQDSADADLKAIATGKGAKSSAKYLINVVMPDKPTEVQIAEVPKSFIKFLRTFQDMVNLMFFDPQAGNVLVFDATPAANGFGCDYKIVQHKPMPVSFTGEQIPDLDEVLKELIESNYKPLSSFTGNLKAPLGAPAAAAAPAGFQGTLDSNPNPFAAAAPTPAPAADPFGAFAAAPAPAAPATAPVAPAPAPAADPFAAFTAGAPASAPAAAPADPFAAFATGGMSAPPAAPAQPSAPTSAVAPQPLSSPGVIEGTAVAVSDAEADELQKKLMSLVG